MPRALANHRFRNNISSEGSQTEALDASTAALREHTDDRKVVFKDSVGDEMFVRQQLSVETGIVAGLHVLLPGRIGVNSTSNKR